MATVPKDEVEGQLLEMRRRLESLSCSLKERSVNLPAPSAILGQYKEAGGPDVRRGYDDRRYHVASRLEGSSAAYPPARQATGVVDSVGNPTEVREGDTTAAAEQEAEPFDAFSAIQRRLREKVRMLQSSNAVPAAEGPALWAAQPMGAQTIGEPTSPPPHPPSSACAGATDIESTVKRLEVASPQSTEYGSPPKDSSVSTAPPPATDHSPSRLSVVEMELSTPVANPVFEDSSELSTPPPPGGVNPRVDRSAHEDGHSMSTVRPVERCIIGGRRQPLSQRASGASTARKSPSPSPPHAANTLNEQGGIPARQTSKTTSKPSVSRSRSMTGSTGTRTSGSRARSGTAGDSRHRETGWNDSTSLRKEPLEVPKPRPLWTEAIHLELVSGAELLAIFRMRGLVTSSGDTGEDRLPDTRCHAIYLTPRERDQLQMLRDILQHRQYAAEQQRSCRR